MVEANQELKEIQQEEERVRRIADRNLEQAITTFADLILEANVNSEAEGSDDTRRLAGIMRNYLARNIDFARQEQHTAVEIAMLRRLALLEYDLRNERMFIEHFDTAIALAEREERFDMAADLQVEYADVRVKSFSHQGAPVTAKARLLLQSALLNYERELANRTRDDRIQLAMAVAHKRLAETFELEDANELALDHLDRARALHMELRPSDEQLTVIDRQARLYEALGEIGTAKRLINESISVAEDIEKYNFVSDKHLKLARLSNEPNETTTQLCLAWEALERLDPDQSKRLRFESRAVRVQEDFNVAEC